MCLFSDKLAGPPVLWPAYVKRVSLAVFLSVRVYAGPASLSPGFSQSVNFHSLLALAKSLEKKKKRKRKERERGRKGAGEEERWTRKRCISAKKQTKLYASIEGGGQLANIKPLAE